MKSLLEKTRVHLQSFARPVNDRYIDVLDGVRAILVLLVGWFHIWQQSWLTPRFTLFGRQYSLDFLLRSGYIWVDGLILLSGFLLYLPYARAGNGKLPDTKAFFKKRLLRIWPSYALNVLVFFLISLPKYQGNVPYMAKDICTHLTFTHTFFRDTYYGSPINGALWTVGVEFQFYILFPLLGRCYRQKPLLTAGGMMAAAFLWRGYAHTLQDCAMWFNQLPAFLDVYALGFMGADAFIVLRRKMQQESRREKVFFTLICFLCLWVLNNLAHTQAASNGQEAIRWGQMNIRFALALALTVFMVCAAFAAYPVRLLLGNRVMQFLAGVSFQFYMYHQVLAVLMKQYGIIPSQSPTPNVAGEQPWQLIYTLVCFIVPLALGAVLTYGFERPIVRLFAQRREKDGRTC